MSHTDSKKQDDDVLVLYKPSGIKTHRSSPEDWGFIEWVEEKLQRPLYLFQRLDVGTSGLLLVAQTPAAAQIWTEKLASKKLQKTYLFLTHETEGPTSPQRVTSHISKQKGLWISDPSETPNSETFFTLVESYENFHLWKAEPRTGKAHQIRLHAQSLGIPILGDVDHGGRPFFRLCLHALELKDPSLQKQWNKPAPPFFTDLSLLKNPELCALLDGWHQRMELQSLGLLPLDCLRISHQENPSLRVDQFGSQLWVYDYRADRSSQTSLSPSISSSSSNPSMPETKGSPAGHPQLPTTDLIKACLPLSTKPVWIREMKNRGSDPNEAHLIPLNDPSSRWEGTENNLRYEFRADQGLSPGLFLDQRANRQWVCKNSKEKSVLNLFSYTCGFSLCAAAGGARTVVSVDVSPNFLEWGKKNFELNDLDPKNFEFWSADSMEFIKRAQKLQRKFDLIVCDPPSFGRSKKGVFRIQTDLGPMVEILFALLSEKGLLLLSTNYEKWSLAGFEEAATKRLSTKSWKKRVPPKGGLDFLETQHPLLKTLLLEKL